MKPLYPTILKHLEDNILLSVKDNRLLQLFTIYDTEISEWLEATRPQNNEWAKWEGEKEIEFIGPMFHKAFRQQDILPTAKEDMDVWQALYEGCSEFWPALEKAINA